ncbi:MAG TPA: RNA methyltransferase [Solirubrobacteraceae bacterium]|jgi:TrmH family RNA methyltransferase|nr:RNA methyltransferase [Solirubrobacteraceae bacterium]
MTITSSDNEKLKTLRKLRQRRRERERLGQFVAEGEDLLAAADAAGWVPVERFAASGSGLPGIEVDATALKSVTELASGTRTLAIYNERWEAEVAATQSALCVYLHAIADPGNVGTVLRSAAAFGAGCVAFGPGSADPFGPKAVRASMGAIFGVPVAHATPDALPGTTIALDARAERTLAEVAAEIPAAAQLSVLIGAERDGLPAELVAGASVAARIPIATESLNAAIAASVALYELSKRTST